MRRPTNYPCLGLALVLAGMLGFVTASGVRFFGASWWHTVGAGTLVLLVFTGLFYVALENMLNAAPDEPRRGSPDQGALLDDLGGVATGEHARSRR